ncbi:hypothetical protein KI387_027972 [Taxus chinensis]|uniref:Chloride channel protein n=1 Tax=Taxus chinensis TaxID=29808 RepID=A0AA38LA02_TAXCH|nr:hypothetical protein KI387_027972 [Taxus chinensis]
MTPVLVGHSYLPARYKYGYGVVWTRSGYRTIASVVRDPSLASRAFFSSERSTLACQFGAVFRADLQRYFQRFQRKGFGDILLRKSKGFQIRFTAAIRIGFDIMSRGFPKFPFDHLPKGATCFGDCSPYLEGFRVAIFRSEVSNVIIGGKSAFTVPAYELKSAAELPLYLILGMICGVVSVVFSRLVSWLSKLFVFLKERFGIPTVINPALGGLGAGLIALRYPGILYWGFTNVDEILHTGKNATAPGIWLLTQLLGAKVVATALCKGSGLVGGLYAPSLMIGAAVGAVFGGSAAELINAAIPGNAAVAHPQAYALVGMAATLASVCSVPLTSVLLLFELTKDYRILLPLMGAVGLAFWMASVANQSKDTECKDKQGSVHAYSPLTDNGIQHNVQDLLRKMSDGKEVELCVLENGTGPHIPEDDLLHELKVVQAMSKSYIKVSANCSVKDAIQLMLEFQQNCVLVVDDEDLLEGIMTLGDLQREVQGTADTNVHSDMTTLDVNTTLVSAVCTRRIHYRGHERGILICYPDTDLMMAKEIMEARGIKQLPVVKRIGERRQECGRKLVGLLYYDAIADCVREARQRVVVLVSQSRKDKNDEILLTGH